MDITQNQLFDAALALPTSLRSELADKLILSLEKELPPGQDRTPQEWEAEIMRRSDELHAGKATFMDADDSIEQGKALIAKLRQS